MTQAREAEIRYIEQQNTLELNKLKETSNVEIGKFENMVKAIGADTLKAIAQAGPEMQVSDTGIYSL